MKRLTRLILLLSLLAVLVISFAACKPAHEHDLEWVEDSPTCTEDGSKYQRCRGCTQRVGEPRIIPATGHTRITVDGTAPTCTASGTGDSEVCEICHTVFTPSQPLPALGHTYEDQICTLCGVSELDELTFTLSDDGEYYIVSEGGFRGSTLVIPSTYEGLPVREIAEDGFDSSSNLIDVTVPESVVKIGKRAFKSMDIKSLTILGGCEIGEEAFCECSSLYTVTLGGGTTSIGASAFEDCESLAAVTIPASVTSIGNNAFQNCRKLGSIVFAEGSMLEVIPENCFNLQKSSGDGATAVTLPEGLRRIERLAFCLANIEDITFPDGLEYIGSEAFVDNKLTELYIPDSVQGIGAGAFSGNRVETLTVPFLGATRTGERHEYDHYGRLLYPDRLSYIFGNNYYDFKNDTLKSLTILPGITSIQNFRVSDYKALVWIDIPDGVTDFGEYAFSGGKFKSIILPPSLTTIGKDAFAGCNIYEIINCSETLRFEAGSDEYSGIAKNVIRLEQSTTAIGAGTEISVDDDGIVLLTSAGGGIIGYIGNATELTLGVDGKYGTVHILGNAFQSNTTLKKVTLGASVHSIPPSAFKGCTALTEVYFDASSPITVLYDTFNNCKALTTVTLPSGLTSLEYTFLGCSALKSVNIPSSVVRMLHPFDKFDCLENVSYLDGVYYLSRWVIGCEPTDMPESLTLSAGIGIASGALNYASSKSITVPTDYKYICFVTNSVGYTTSCTFNYAVVEELSLPFLGYTIDVPTKIDTMLGNSGSKLKKLTVFGGQITDKALSDCTSLETVDIGYQTTLIGSKAFYGCPSLKSVEIGKHVTSIGSRAFFWCTALTEVTFIEGSELATLGESVFAGCTSLGGVAFPATITEIPDGTFYGCTSIDAVKMGAGVTAISSDAFYGCTGITWVALPLTLETVHKDAFRGCTALTKIYYGGTEADWTELGYTLPEGVTVYYYTSNEPTGEGNYWYEDAENGYLPVEW